MRSIRNSCIMIMIMLVLCLSGCKESSLVSNVVHELNEDTSDIPANEGTEVINQRVGEEIGLSSEEAFSLKNRCQLIVKGLTVSLVISIFSSVFGALLSFGLLLSLQKEKSWLSGFAKAFCRLIAVLPAVILLALTSFVFFVFTEFELVVIAICAFALMFAISMVSILQKRIDSVDKGQLEASFSLGFGYKDTFDRIILPQTLCYALPLCKAEFLKMLKLVFFVGYLSIQDFEIVGYVLRNHTYGMFFPLVLTAAIYFMISYLLVALAGKIEWKIGFKSRIRRLPKSVSVGCVSNLAKADRTSFAVGNNTVLVTIEHLRKEYGNTVLLKDVNAVVRKGEIISLIGAHGAGKSTLLRCINQLEIPSSGKVTAFGYDLSAKRNDFRHIRQRIGMVSQNFNLFCHLSVVENIMLAPIVLKKESKQIVYDNAMRLLSILGLAEKALCSPAELSDGEKLCVAIARTLAMKPEVILFDEPVSAFDPATVCKVSKVIKQLALHVKTILVATSDMKFAREISSRVFYLDEGIIYEEGAPEEVFEHPKRDKTRAFVQQRKVLSLPVESADYDFFAISEALHEFGEENVLEKKRLKNLQCIFEEVFSINIILNGSPIFPLEFVTEYGAGSDRLEMRFIWKGRKYNPLENGDESSLKLVQEAISDSNFSYEDGKNRLAIAI